MTRQESEALAAEIERLRAETAILRGLLAKLTIAEGLPCHFCGAAEIIRCPAGFPGCALADDLLLGQDQAFAAWAKRTKGDRGT